MFQCLFQRELAFQLLSEHGFKKMERIHCTVMERLVIGKSPPTKEHVVNATSVSIRAKDKQI